MPKVLVIGLDGATFTLLTPGIETGLLPPLQAIRDNGVWGTLQSTIPPVTAPAWQNFMTGKNPGKHGVANSQHGIVSKPIRKPVDRLTLVIGRLETISGVGFESSDDLGVFRPLPEALAQIPEYPVVTPQETWQTWRSCIPSPDYPARTGHIGGRRSGAA